MTSVPTRHPRWRFVIPVRQGPAAKQRLVLDDEARTALHAAMATDVITAATGVAGADAVAVVTDDLPIAQKATMLGCEVLADPGRGLNGAIEVGLERWAASTEPTVQPTAYAVLMADLPGADTPTLVRTLAEAEDLQSTFVPDAPGDGTTLLAGRRPEPRFGPGSARAHHASGAVALHAPIGLRRDVDDLEDLATLAARTPLGPHTLEACRTWQILDV